VYQDSNTTKNKLDFFRIALFRSRDKKSLSQECSIYTGTETIDVANTDVIFFMRSTYTIQLSGAMVINTKLNYFGETYRTNNPGGAVTQLARVLPGFIYALYTLIRMQHC